MLLFCFLHIKTDRMQFLCTNRLKWQHGADVWMLKMEVWCFWTRLLPEMTGFPNNAGSPPASALFTIRCHWEVCQPISGCAVWWDSFSSWSWTKIHLINDTIYSSFINIAMFRNNTLQAKKILIIKINTNLLWTKSTLHSQQGNNGLIRHPSHFRSVCVARVCVLVRSLCMCEWNLPWFLSAHLTWLLELLIGRGPGVSDLQQTGFHRHQIHLGAVALGVVQGTLAPAVVVPAHQLAFLITADVAESSLHKASPQILREDGLKTCSEDGNGAHDCAFEIRGNHRKDGGYFPPVFKQNTCLASYSICWVWLMVLFILHCSATLIVNHYWDSLQYAADTRGKKSRRVIEAKFILTHWCCSYKVAREQTLWQFHQKLGEFNYGCPTLQMNLVFRALNQNGADRIKVVIVTASERACSCFGHLKGEKQAHNNSYWERNQHTCRERKWREML